MMSQEEPPKWHHPKDVMKLYKLKQKKKALQARISGNILSNNTSTSPPSQSFEDLLSKKRKNPFLSQQNNEKKSKLSNVIDESSDQTLFKLLHSSESGSFSGSFTSFRNILGELSGVKEPQEKVEVVKAQGEKWLPIDWSLKSKIRLLSERPFPWNSKLKISEEASGITAFTRCLDSNSSTTLDTSSNSKLHQCSLYWQQPSFPWLKLFPRSSAKSTSGPPSFASQKKIKDSLQASWTDSLRSLFQLIRTKQCPYFYACSNSFTVLFRAAGVCGFSELHAMITPTTRGFRNLLKQEDIEFTMPLKPSESPLEDKEDEEPANEKWLKSLGCKEADIKEINYAQQKIVHKIECEIDNSEQSLLLVEGVEVNALYNFLINCKSTISLTGPLAGIPPTLLAPVAFHGASLNALKVQENKVNVDGSDLYSLDLSGPILPSTIHQLFSVSLPEHSMTASFNSVTNTESFSKVTRKFSQQAEGTEGATVFCKENLSDCGLNVKVLKHFCSPNEQFVDKVECLKYTSENRTYTWS